MCGITGFLDLSGHHPEEALIRDGMLMSATLRHRGPDDSGIWMDEAAGVCLAHRRLSIIDLSIDGRQPMHSACGRYVIIFNGEIYNFQNLRHELEREGATFHTRTDTEVILQAVRAWGLEAAVKRFVGMFAFGLWDRHDQVLYLVRDRLGIKPLYYGRLNSVFLFGSELKSLRAHPGFRSEINRNALALYLRHNYVPAPYSIYQHIYKLMPGSILQINGKSGEMERRTSYWSAADVIQQGRLNPFSGSESEAVEELEKLIKESVRLRMIGDVPNGAFLSGGIDSSTVVSIMQSLSERPIQTFTIGFHESSFDEIPFARRVARHLGTNHTEQYLTPEEAQAIIPLLPTMYDEPFADASQIPTHLVSRLARRYVTVSLSGDGGDELFCGYDRYRLGMRTWNMIRWIPRDVRRMGGWGLETLPVSWLNASVGKVLPRIVPLDYSGGVGDKLHKFARILSNPTSSDFYYGLISCWKNPEDVVVGGMEPPNHLERLLQLSDRLAFSEWMMFADLVNYLPDDILAKVDRASMAVSLEARVPLLDHRLVEFAWRLPLRLKFRHGQGKWILRQVLAKYVPLEFLDRSKMGFGVPIGDWLRGPLRDWAEDLLNERRLEREGFFHPGIIAAAWQEHLAGMRNWQYRLWPILQFQAWWSQQREQSGGDPANYASCSGA